MVERLILLMFFLCVVHSSNGQTYKEIGVDIPNYLSQYLNIGDRVEGRVVVEGDTLIKGVGGTVASYVDLGIKDANENSILWATHNLGASKPEEYGAYIAWGEKGTKEEGYIDGVKTADYYWSTLAYYDVNTSYLSFSKSSRPLTFDGSFSKYVTTDTCGMIDNRIVIEGMDDAAKVNWGSNWRMPTSEEWTKLRENCVWTWYAKGNLDYNGVAGYKVTGLNGNSIFLPASGFYKHTSSVGKGFYGLYWSSSLVESFSYIAYIISFRENKIIPHFRDRFWGLSIRPVFCK